MNNKSSSLIVTALLYAGPMLAQDRSPSPARERSAPAPRAQQSGPKTIGDYSSDIVVVRDAQEQARDQVKDAQDRAQDPRTQTAVETALKEMEQALARLEEAKQSPDKLPAALAAEQAAYQALLKLAAREYQVSRSRNGQQGGQQGQRMMRQLDQLDLRQTENRYETQSQASPQQNAQQREQLQVLNRLKELAQRQQDLNERIKELQTALQEAKTEKEREEIRRRLKRLREEEQQMLADLDELRQRMDRPENQSRMADSREQLDKTRSEVQRAAESLDNSSVPQALTSGTRAERELQQLADDFRKKSSSRFSDEMRQMRDDARRLAQKEQELASKLDELADARHKTLGDSDERKGLADELLQQKSAATNLFNEMRRVSEQSETAEPLLSKQLYDTLRQSNQEEMNKSLDLSAELVQRAFLSQAGQFEQRAQQRIDELKRGVEKAADSVLGDETEALRLAKRELETLSQQLEREMAQASTNTISTNGTASTGETTRQRYGLGSQAQTNLQTASARGEKPGSPNERSMSRDQSAQNETGQNGEAQRQGSPSGANNASSDQQLRASAQQAQNGQQESPNQSGRGQRAGQPGSQGGDQASSAELASNDARNQDGQRGGAGGRRNFYEGGAEGGGGNGGAFRPLTGDNFTDWSDRLRDVEEMLDDPDLRTGVARIRDRARVVRYEYKREGKKPDWAVVRLDIAGPLAEVRDRVSEELLRRESREAIVPIDRDPVPQKFSELVRRYYEQLGKSE